MPFTKRNLDDLLAVTAADDVTGPELLVPMLEALARTVDAVFTAAFETQQSSRRLVGYGQVAFESTGDEPEEAEALFWDAWAESPVSWTEPGTAFFGRYPATHPLDPDRLFASRREAADSKMRRTFGRAIRLGHHVLVPLDSPPGSSRRICVERPLSDRPFDDAALTSLRLVQPHLDAGLKRALNGSPARALLSPRELEILAYVRGGTSTKDIAAALWVSPSTVRKHLENVYTKLDVHGRTEAVAKVYAHPGAASPPN